MAKQTIVVLGGGVGGAAGIAQGDFFAHPRRITMRSPSPIWHWGKVAFERYWLWRWY